MTIFSEPNIKGNGLAHGCHCVTRRVNGIVCSQDVPGNPEDMRSYPNEDSVHFAQCPCSAPLQGSEPKGIAEGQEASFLRRLWAEAVNAWKMPLLGTGIWFENLFLPLPFDNVIHLAATGCLAAV